MQDDRIKHLREKTNEMNKKRMNAFREHGCNKFMKIIWLRFLRTEILA